MRSPENVLESLKSKACNKSYKYERLYRNLYNPQFYLLAYQRIQAKPGNMTAGTDGSSEYRRAAERRAHNGKPS